MRPSSLIKVAAWILGSCLALSSAPTRADEPPPAPSITLRPSAVDPRLETLRRETISVRLLDGRELRGELLAYDAAYLLLRQPGQEPCAIARTDIAWIDPVNRRPAPIAPTARTIDPFATEDAESRRHFALHATLIAPGLGMDLSLGRFYGFANVALYVPLPMDSNARNWGGSLGLGASWRMGSRTNWHFDVFGHLSLYVSDDFPLVAVGAGLGFHYTAPSGFTVAIKLPINGLVPQGGPFYGTAYYYLVAPGTMPLLSIGYRF